MMKITEKEIEMVSKLDAFKRYKYLLKKVASFEKMYSLKSPENNWAISEVDYNGLFPIWSAPEFPNNCTFNGWNSFTVYEISLEQFQDNLIDFFNKESYLLNVFPVGETTGFVVDVNEFVRDLRDELDKY